MNNKPILCLILLVLFLAGSIAYAQTQRNTSMKRTWEYKIVDGSPTSTLEKTLNQLGAEGWEFVAVNPANFTYATCSPELVP